MSDVDSLLPFYTDPFARRYLGGAVSVPVARARIDQAIRSWKDHHFGPWLVCDHEDSVVAWGGLSQYCGGPRVEVSYQVMPSRWRQGHGRALLDHSIADAFVRLRLHERWAETQGANVPSTRLLESAGFAPVEAMERYGAQQRVFVLRTRSLGQPAPHACPIAASR
jgi:RimJ/RimL family protein N-acetyltransferase